MKITINNSPDRIHVDALDFGDYFRPAEQPGYRKQPSSDVYIVCRGKYNAQLYYYNITTNTFTGHGLSTGFGQYVYRVNKEDIVLTP